MPGDEKMSKKTKLYLRLNLISLFFVIVSFISVTLAWFVYSGLSTATTEVNVKAWYIELEKNGEKVSNNIVISLDDIYPGMEPIEEEIKIKNLGDSDAQVKYEIISARILGDPKDNYVINETMLSNNVEDRIAHEYPFHINIDLNKKFILAGTDESTFKVSISWPLDSGDDELDSVWGTNAYNYKIEEQNKKDADDSYQIQAAIKLDIKLTADQYIQTDESSDIEYRRGNEILYDVVLNKRCTEESSTCIRTNVIDVNNTVGDKTVTLLPKVSNEYSLGTFDNVDSIYKSYTSKWTVESRLLSIKDILPVVSKDIKNSVLVSPNLSDLVIGNLSYENRIDKVILNSINKNGYFKYLNKFSYFYSTDCYWLNDEYNIENAFAVTKLDDNSMKIYGEAKTSSCKIIPVIIAEKVNLRGALSNGDEVTES